MQHRIKSSPSECQKATAKRAKLDIWNEFPQSDGRLIILLGRGGSVWDCNCHIAAWAEAEPGNVKTYLLGTILVETLYESNTDTLNTSLIYYAFSFKWLISLFLNRS